MMCLRFLVSLPLLLLALLALSFQQGSAGLTTTTTAPSSATAAASSQSTRPSSPSFVVAIRQPAAESRTLAPPAAPSAPAVPAAPAAPAPALLIKRADPVAENKTEPAKPAEPAAARMPKCVRKTGVAGNIGGWFRIRPVFWVRTFDVSGLEQEGVSDSDLEEKLVLEMRRKCPNAYGWQYFRNQGDGKGATVLFTLKGLTRKKCVEEAFREAGFPKDFKC